MIILNNKFRTSKNLLLFSFILFIIIPTLTIGTVIFIYSSQIIKDKIIIQTSDVIEQIGLNVETKASEIEGFLNGLSSNEHVQDLLLNGNFSDYNSNLQQQFLSIDQFIQSNHNIELPIDNILFFHLQQGFYYFNKKIYFEETDIRKSPWYQNTVALRGETNWIGEENQKSFLNSQYTFNVAKLILSKNSFKLIGVVHISLKDNLLGPFFKDLGNGDTISVLNQHNDILFSSSPLTLGRQFTYDVVHNPSNHIVKKVDGTDYLIIRSNPNKYGWVIVKQIPMNSLTGDIWKIRNYAVVIIFICLMIFAVFLFLIYRNISMPLQYLVNFFNDIESNYAEINFKKSPVYELIRIRSSMISLVEKNKTTSDELKVSTKKSKELEISKLQAQINPHFLYNTLNFIKIIAQDNKQIQISTLLYSLIIFLKSTINRNGSFIPLQEELDHLKHYTFLINSMYRHQIDFVFEIDENLNDQIVPNFILQPLVENCILHGIQPLSGQSRIVIRTYREDNDLVILVEDNGIGISEGKLEEILFKPVAMSNRLGIRATNEKIKIVYGLKFGIKIQSQINEGTKAFLRIPMDAGYPA
jgi:two-component system sensor histidine kinase YesM